MSKRGIRYFVLRTLPYRAYLSYLGYGATVFDSDRVPYLIN